ncbi:MAG: trypsin-like peptidase domain-containing protein [Myxococcales bacterium]|nr:trypsin-like peptidase domain-containing protein [Myxococcales bacterium]
MTSEATTDWLQRALLITGSQGKQLGSGFVVARREATVVIATCAHVVKPADTAIYVGGIAAKVLFCGEHVDLALLEVADLAELTPLPLAPKRVGIGCKVIVVGWRSDGVATLCEEVHCQIEKQVKESYQGHKEQPAGYRLKTPNDEIALGYSGGPVIDPSTGQLIGVLEARRGSTVAYAIAAEELRAVIAPFGSIVNDHQSGNRVSLRQDPRALSRNVATNWTRLRGAITRLTEDQYRVVAMTQHGQTRVLVTGCAGSGKTLVAVEKACRFAHAGLRTLLICHSPHLAAFLRELVAGSAVECFDFEHWIRTLVDPGSVVISEGWMQYAEPTSDDLELAQAKLAMSEARYGAVVVDEGQDFRQSWWDVVTMALSDERSHFYVFMDDNQALLPHRGRPPIAQQIRLSRNCRNAGQVFELVRRIHPCAPLPERQLTRRGIVEWFPINDFSQACAAVRLAVTEALRHTPPSLVVLTTEPDPVSSSVVCGLEMADPSHQGWQGVVLDYLTSLQPELRRYKRPAELPTLSDARHPTQDDIWAVCSFARRWPFPGRPDAKLSWRRRTDVFDLGGLAPERGRRGAQIAEFFSMPVWANGLGPSPSWRIAPGGSFGVQTIPLYTVATFKGLEADAVVLLEAPNAKLGRSSVSYVGVSRARMLLHVVADATTEMLSWDLATG